MESINQYLKGKIQGQKVSYMFSYVYLRISIGTVITRNIMASKGWMGVTKTSTY